MIKIITGYSLQGGSTTAHMNLVNAFNEFGLNACLYGPHNYPEDKCKFELIQNLQIDPDDVLIFHYIQIPNGLKAKKIILSVHEQNLFDLSKVNLNNVDIIHFVAEHQKNYHNADSYNKPYFILSNVSDDLKPNPKKRKKSVGIIGSVDVNKQVHVSILRAIGKGFKDITLYGKVTDQNYYETKVLPLIKKYNIKGPKFTDNKQEMYDNITDVFFSSINECLPFVIGECKLTNTNIHLIEGKNYTNGYYETDKKLIVEKWKEIMEI